MYSHYSFRHDQVHEGEVGPVTKDDLTPVELDDDAGTVYLWKEKITIDLNSECYPEGLLFGELQHQLVTPSPDGTGLGGLLNRQIR